MSWNPRLPLGFSAQGSILCPSLPPFSRWVLSKNPLFTPPSPRSSSSTWNQVCTERRLACDWERPGAPCAGVGAEREYTSEISPFVKIQVLIGRGGRCLLVRPETNMPCGSYFLTPGEIRSVLECTSVWLPGLGG